MARITNIELSERMDRMESMFMAMMERMATTMVAQATTPVVQPKAPEPKAEVQARVTEPKVQPVVVDKAVVLPTPKAPAPKVPESGLVWSDSMGKGKPKAPDFVPVPSSQDNMVLWDGAIVDLTKEFNAIGALQTQDFVVITKAKRFVKTHKSIRFGLAKSVKDIANHSKTGMETFMNDVKTVRMLKLVK